MSKFIVCLYVSLLKFVVTVISYRHFRVARDCRVMISVVKTNVVLVAMTVDLWSAAA